MDSLWNGKAALRSEITDELTATDWNFATVAFLRFSESRAITFGAVLLLTVLFAQLPLLGQTPITTWHYDNGRSGADTTETLLTPSNVNTKSFGKLFTLAVDGYIVGHPLYLPGISISGQGTHNVVYVATMHDSVYAFDADSGSTTPLWMTSLLSYSPAGATSVPAAAVKKDAGTTGWTELGIISTPVIDPATGTLYAVAETYESGKVVHRLHALDVTSGLEKFGGPQTIAATYTLNGVTTTFNDLNQMNRPALLMANSHIYIAFGSNGNNATPCQGWVLSYNSGTLLQEGAYTVEPGKVLASIWQKGAGLSVDTTGNIYAESGEGPYAAGTNLSSSVQKLSQTGTTLALADWFTPYNQEYLSENDLDLDDGILILPDQPGPYPHELITAGKEGTIYVLNRDNMGQYCSSCTTADTQIVQELPQAAPYSGIPVYWNNTVYFTAQHSPAFAYTLSNGMLLAPPVKSILLGGGGHAVITANGTSDGILWTMNGSNLYAFDAGTLKTLYDSNQAAGGRDTLPPLPHFASPVAADGKVFIGTQSSVVIFGLFPTLSSTAGNGQSAPVASTLPVPLTVQALNLYTQNTFPGVAVTFSDGGKGGTFNPPTAVTDSTGSASTSYTLPAKIGSYTLTASATGYPAGLFTETALSASATSLASWSGNNQSAPVTTPLPNPLVLKVKDSFGNGVAGVQVSYTDSGSGGSFSLNPATTNSAGLASVTYTTSKTAGALHGKILASVPGLTSLIFFETVTPGPAANIAATSGSGQSTPSGTQLAQPLVAKVTDQYGNAVSGVVVTFNDGGAGGTFSANPVSTSSSGVTSVTYTTSANAGTVTIQAAASGVSTPAAFTETVQ